MSSNIFLQPFSPKLFICVLTTLILVVGVMEIINYVTLYIHWQEDEEHFGLGEAALWCLSIMCAQGSPWTPKTRAGQAVLLCSLFFSLIIYNSYSGFITSILSVKPDTIKNVSDFFEYDYIFGCSKSDDNYIISNLHKDGTKKLNVYQKKLTANINKSTQLKEEFRNFYMKTLESGQMKIPEKEGLERTLNGHYAFFISETVAKRIFRNTLRFKRCMIDELQTTTPGTLALPMPENSPYKKIINNGILRMWQYGMLSKLTREIKPPLLDCMRVLMYKQAHLTDVYGAFCILAVGAVAAVALFFFERAWASRQRLRGIQRRITGARRAVARNPGVLTTVRLPMKILGFNRELQEGKDLESAKPTKNSAFNFFKSRNANREQFRNTNEQLFPYYP